MSNTLEEASRSVPTSRINPRVLLLALGMFALGSDVNVVAGVLPEIAHATMVSESLAGQVVTAFTLTYGLGAPVLAALTRSFPRNRILVLALGGFCLANVGSALAPTFPLLLLTRVLAGACAATHSPLAYATSTQLAPPQKRGQALALVVSGFTMATVLGSPLGTWVGEHASWRLSFTLVALLAGIACVVLLIGRLPKADGQPSLSLKTRLAPVREPRLLLALFSWATTSLLTGLPVLFLWAGGAASIFTPQQHRLLSLAPAWLNVILALNNSALYLGVALGAILGGLALRVLPVTLLGWVGAGFTLLALLLFLLSLKLSATGSGR